MAERPDAELLDDAVRQARIAFESLALAMERIDEVQGRPRNIPVPLTEEFYEAFKVKLDIRGNLQKQEYKSPLDLVKILNCKKVTAAAVQKLFKKQYEIKWHTQTKDPDPFSFYAFCKSVEDAGGNDVMTYNTRRAHVISRLYQKRAELLQIQNLNHKELCPPIYVRHRDERWTKFTFTTEGLAREESGINWITKEGLREYIDASSKKYDENAIDEEFVDRLGTYRGEPAPEHLYWAVFEEDDYDDQGDDTPFKTQVYVGRSQNGIKERWLGGGTSHCKRMEFSRDVMCNMSSYDPTALLREQLVQLRFLLHKACNRDGSNSGLFIMETGGLALDVAKRSNIDGLRLDARTPILDDNWSPKNMNYGLNGR